MDVCTREDESARGGGFGARIAGLWRRTSELPAAMMAAVKCATPILTVLQSVWEGARCLAAHINRGHLPVLHRRPCVGILASRSAGSVCKMLAAAVTSCV